MTMFEIETARLLLRKFRTGDEQDTFELFSDEQTCLNGGGIHALTEMNEEFYQLFERFLKQDRYAVVLKSESKVIGIINLKDIHRAVPAKEIGFLFNPNYHRCGYAYEALHAMIAEWFCRTDIQMFTTSHFPYNEASKKLVRKLGFSYAGFERKAMSHAVYGPIDLECYFKERET